jgi:hypothetical protein
MAAVSDSVGAVDVTIANNATVSGAADCSRGRTLPGCSFPPRLPGRR